MPVEKEQSQRRNVEPMTTCDESQGRVVVASRLKPLEWEGDKPAADKKEGEEDDDGQSEMYESDSQRFLVGSKTAEDMDGSDADSMASIDYMATHVKTERKEEHVKTENDVDPKMAKRPVKSTSSRPEEKSCGAPPNTNPFSAASPLESGSPTASVVTREYQQSNQTTSEEEGTSKRA